MMVCPRCHAENREGRRFCGECGLSFASTCPSCGFLNEGGEKFCGGCGRSLTATARPVEPRFSSPQTYIPKHLAEKILTSKSALEGERKQVTVLFADLKGSMELLADRDPEEARKLLDPVLERMMEAIHRYEGTVNQVMGDGIMALFGAPVAHEDHAVRACYAALRMQELVNGYAEEARRAHGVNVQIRVGLNSGEVVVRAIGSDLHMDYTAVGQTTHLAARMEQLAEPGTALLTSATLALSQDFVQVKSLGPMRVKGLSEAIEVCELVGANPARSRFHAHAARGLTKFIGRMSEMSQLGEALDLVRNSRGQAVAVVSEPGVGKSRLFWEFAHSHRVDGCLVVEAASVSYGKATTYLPVIELLRGYFQIEPRDDTRRIREEVSGKLFTLDRALEPALAPLLALLDVPVEDEEWTRLDPPERRQRTLDAVKRLLLRESHVQPLVVIFEDLHWIDGETQAVLDGLVESLPAARMLLLVNYRPEYRHDWGSKTYYRQLRIDSLPAANAEELLQALLGRDPGLNALQRLLIERTEGNPFFLEESVRTLVETRVLIGEPGAHRLTGAPESLQIPATAQAVVAARIDRLEAEDKRLLQAASVIGKNVPLVLLEAITDVREDELPQRLARLQAAEFMYETRLFPEVEYTFKHALTHEVAYSGLLQERRRELHARIVEATERLYSDRLEEQVERLALHGFRGQVWEKALAYSRQAGIRAAAKSANREAVAYFEQALTALKSLTEGAATIVQAVDLRFDLRNSLHPLGELTRVYVYLQEAERLAERLGDERRVGRASLYLAHNLDAQGDHEAAVAAGQRALTIGRGLGDLGLQVVANNYLGYFYHALGDYPAAIQVLEEAVAALAGDMKYERFGTLGLPAAVSRTWLAWSCVELGEFGTAAEHGEEAVRLAGAAKHPYSLIIAYWGLGYAYLRRGEVARAVAILESALDLCRDSELRIVFPHSAACAGFAHAHSGRIDSAISLLDKAVEAGASMKFMIGYTLDVAWLGEAYLIAGRIEQASEVGARALDLSRRYKERGYEAWVRWLLGEIACARHPVDHTIAGSHYRLAMALGDQLGMRPLVAHCHLGLGKLSRRTGKRQEAQEHLTTATTMYREMGMTYWLEQAETHVN